MAAEKFATIYARAAKRKGSQSKLESMIGRPLAANDIEAIGDDRFLAEFTKKIFQ